MFIAKTKKKDRILIKFFYFSLVVAWGKVGRSSYIFK